MSQTLLDVKDLKVEYRGQPPTQAVDGVSFKLGAGENLGLVGESGCGKTTTARAILGLLTRTARIVSGAVYWDGADITRYTQREWRRIRWTDIALVPQSAMNSLDPVYRLRDQIVEAIRTHEKVTVQAARARAAQLCKLVGIDPQRLMDYPHQLSGGMKQRMVIAMALALSPRLIVADEPTTALDVIIQDRILDQVVQLQRDLQFSMIYISHDIAVIAETCQRVAVMYAGQIVEQGPIHAVLKTPAHPYTMGLKNAFPDIRQPKQLISIPGHPPTLAPPPGGCRFAPRCPFVTPLCVEQVPPLLDVGGGQWAACHYVGNAPAMRAAAQQAATWTGAADRIEVVSV
jgi:oligopeptide/dipeptide ABC transporter ATP-binding protein